jgi:uncharacterized RDD family membrane protein YckC
MSGNAPATPYTPVGLWRRFMSATYEGVVLFGVAVFFGYAFSALFRYQYDGGDTPMRLTFQLYLLAVFGAYFVWFWSRGRRSLPMKTLSVQLRSHDGGTVSTGQAVVRYLIAAAFMSVPFMLVPLIGPTALLLLPISWIWAVFDPDRATAYDRLSRTRLVLDADPRR